MNITIHEFETVTSTNDLLKEYYGEYLQGLRELTPYESVFALTQTSGRGKDGAGWFSKPGKSFCFSTLFLFDGLIDGGSNITEHIAEVMPIAAGAAKDVLCEMFTADTQFVSKLRVKLPNDVYVGDKKFVGVLGELIDETENNACIVGIDINVDLAPEELPFEQCTSLAIELGRAVGLDEFKDAFIPRYIAKLAKFFPVQFV